MDDVHQTLEDLFGDQEFTKMDGYDDCIAGVIERYGMEPILCYDKEKVLSKLQEDGMSYEEAEEFWSYNQIGAWVGDNTPSFITFINQD
jgi:hypothetical protein